MIMSSSRRTNSGKGASQRVRDFLISRHIEPARRRGQRSVRVVAGEVARELGLRNRFPQICAAMEGQRFLHQNGLEIESREGPRSGQSSTVAITYRLLGGRAAGQELFDSLRGRLREAYAAEGGGEASLKRDRASFDREYEL